MKTVFTLTSAESRRLIAKAVVAMPEFKKAWESAYLLLAGGTTNAFIAQELLGRDGIEPGRCTVGISTDGLLCVTNPDSRKSFPNVFYKGEKSDKTLVEALADFHAETVVIKGANAVDMNGYVGIITSGFDGGTVPRIIGPVTSKGLKFITPVGLEKLVPSVQASAKRSAVPPISTSRWEPIPACTASAPAPSSPRSKPSGCSSMPTPLWSAAAAWAETRAR